MPSPPLSAAAPAPPQAALVWKSADLSSVICQQRPVFAQLPVSKPPGGKQPSRSGRMREPTRRACARTLCVECRAPGRARAMTVPAAVHPRTPCTTQAVCLLQLAAWFGPAQRDNTHKLRLLEHHSPSGSLRHHRRRRRRRGVRARAAICVCWRGLAAGKRRCAVRRGFRWFKEHLHPR